VVKTTFSQLGKQGLHSTETCILVTSRVRMSILKKQQQQQ